MDPNNMSFEEWMKYMDENFGSEASDSQSSCPDEEYGNPYGAGRYGYIRSSKNCKALIRGKNAQFNSEHNRWFEHIRCAYTCWRDGRAEQEYDDMYRDQLEKKRPLISYREAFYELEYGNSRDEVASMMVILTDCTKGNHRSFHFDLDNITMHEAQEYIDALENWSYTGELNIGPYRGIPAYGPWCAK